MSTPVAERHTRISDTPVREDRLERLPLWHAPLLSPLLNLKEVEK